MPYHTKSSGADVPAFEKAIATAFQLAEQLETELIYRVPTLSNLESDAAVEVLGEELIKVLAKHRTAQIGNITVQVETKRQKRSNAKAVVFALYLSLDDLASVKADHRIQEIVFVPWSDVECDQYEADNPDSIPL